MNKRIVKLIGELKLDRKEEEHMKVINAEDIKKRVNNALDITPQNTVFVKHPLYKPAKIISMAAALVLIFGLINIQTVIAFFSGLFFVPGVGLTDNDSIIYYGLEKPIDIETKYGTITLSFASKVTRNGKTNLSIYIDTYNILPVIERDKFHAEIAVKGNKIERFYGNGGFHRRWVDTPQFGKSNIILSKDNSYFYEDFPDVNEFDLIIYDVPTRIILTEQKGNLALSQENNGIVLGVYKFNGIDDMICLDVFDTTINRSKSERMTGGAFHAVAYFDNCYLYDKDGNEIEKSGGSGILNSTISIIYTCGSEKKPEEIKNVKLSVVGITYDMQQSNNVDLPVPKDGETIQTNIKIPVNELIYEITEVRREGNIIYYKENCASELESVKVSDIEKGNMISSSQINLPESGTVEYEKAVENREAILYSVELSYNQESSIKKLANGAFWLLDENAETINIKFDSFSIVQYGNFDIEFE